MSYANIIKNEIASEVNSLIDLGVRFQKEKVVQNILSHHNDELISDFTRFTSYQHVLNMVGEFVRANLELNKKNNSISDNQLSIEGEGFDRVQKAYAVKGEVIPVYDLTDEEADIIVKQFDTQIKGLEDHKRQFIRHRQKHVLPKQKK